MVTAPIMKGVDKYNNGLPFITLKWVDSTGVVSVQVLSQDGTDDIKMWKVGNRT